MNKAITEGLVFMPPAFAADTLALWARGDGTPGSPTYDGLATAAFVPADQDFGGCLEIQKSDATQKLRFTGQTPLPLGCYLRITVRIKAVAGALPDVRIAGFAAKADGSPVAGVTVTSGETTLTSYGDVVEIAAIVGAGNRSGVDLVWGTEAAYGHFGIDLTGPNGGVVRVDDIEIEDITSAFLRDMMSWVDVRDYGAQGDGVTDDHAAFVAADNAANGRLVLVSSGTYLVGQSLTLANRVRFEGTLDMPTAAILSLTKDFALPTYVDAFGGDEELAFKKAVQSLMNGADHDSLDLGGRLVSIHAPVDVQAAVPNHTSYAQRRVIRNGQLRAEASGNWNPEVVTSTASYSAATPDRLTAVANSANISVGSLVTGAGVGREVYVRAVNVAAQEVTLSQPLSDAVGAQTYTFTRFKYLLDFSGFQRIDAFELDAVDFQCQAQASGVALPVLGEANVVRNCTFHHPGHRALTSFGDGCRGLMVDQCQFVGQETAALAQARVAVAISVNGDNVRLRNSRGEDFRHFAVISGRSSVVSGNQITQADTATSGARTAGIVLARAACEAQITGNSIADAFVEWTNEREPEPDYVDGESFAGLSVTNNVMVCSDVAPSFGFVVVKPFGSGHFINGLTVAGNSFWSESVTIERADRVDASFAPLANAALKAVHFAGNSFHNVITAAQNPLVVRHSQNTAAQVWTVESGGALPFAAQALGVDSAIQIARPRNESNVTSYAAPYALTQQGGAGDQVQLIWPEPVLGEAAVVMRCDT